MRLFYAIAADTEIKAAAAAAIERLRRAGGDYRWVNPRDMHVTLRFIGEVGEESLQEMRTRLRAAATAAAPFQVIYGRVGAFESPQDPRVLWIGVASGLEPLRALAERLGRDEPRPFAPHLTLGRRRLKTDPAPLLKVLQTETELGLSRPVGKISLYASRPATFGHTYAIIDEAALAGLTT